MPAARAARRRRGDLARAPHCSTRRSRCAPPGSPRPVLAWLIGPGEALGATRSRADVDLSVDARLGARRGRRGGPASRAARRGCTSRSTPASAAAARRRPTGRTWSRPPRKAEADGVGRVVGRLVALRLRRRARPPDDRRARPSVFREAVDAAPSGAGCDPEVRHLANSAATLTAPEQPLRPGAARASPSTGCHRCPTWPARAARAAPGDDAARAGSRWSSGCRPGSGVSYGHIYTTDRETTLGAGAARLRRRRAAARRATSGRCCAAGRRRTVAGRVCMDQFVVDLGDDDGRGRRRGGAVRPRRRRRADRAGLGRRDRHHLLRDRHPGRPAGAARLRRRGGACRDSVPTGASGRRRRRRRRRRRGRRRGRPGGRAVRRRPVVPRPTTPRRDEPFGELPRHRSCR